MIFLRELLLYDVMMSIKYLIALRQYSFIFIVLSYASFVSLGILALSYRQRYKQIANQIEHQAKQKLLQSCSSYPISLYLLSVPLWIILNQQAIKSTASPISCIILNMIIPLLFCCLARSMMVSYLDYHLITLLASISSLQTLFSFVFGQQALHVLIIEQTNLKYLSIFMLKLKCLSNFYSKNYHLFFRLYTIEEFVISDDGQSTFSDVLYEKQKVLLSLESSVMLGSIYRSEKVVFVQAVSMDSLLVICFGVCQIKSFGHFYRISIQNSLLVKPISQIWQTTSEYSGKSIFFIQQYLILLNQYCYQLLRSYTKICYITVKESKQWLNNQAEMQMHFIIRKGQSMCQQQLANKRQAKAIKKGYLFCYIFINTKKVILTYFYKITQMLINKFQAKQTKKEVEQNYSLNFSRQRCKTNIFLNNKISEFVNHKQVKTSMNGENKILFTPQNRYISIINPKMAQSYKPNVFNQNYRQSANTFRQILKHNLSKSAKKRALSLRDQKDICNNESPATLSEPRLITNTKTSRSSSTKIGSFNADLRKKIQEKFQRTKIIFNEEIKMKKIQKIQQIYENKLKSIQNSMRKEVKLGQSQNYSPWEKIRLRSCEGSVCQMPKQ